MSKFEYRILFNIRRIPKSIYEIPRTKVTLNYPFYIGAGNGLASDESYSEEFHVLKQDDFKAKDLKLAKIFDDSESGVASYRLPTKIVDGIYTGCKACGQDEELVMVATDHIIGFPCHYLSFWKILILKMIRIIKMSIKMFVIFAIKFVKNFFF